jgi:prepilin-type N-terminal cleavage/methylation domain-containing protein
MERNRRGFTLIECLVATAVFFIVIAGLSSLTVTVIKGNSFSQAMTVATALAADKIESLQNMSYETAVSGGPEALQSIYSRQWVVIDNSPAPNMKTITVTVTWRRLGAAGNVNLRTMITR